jgi:hypothetical protein
VLVSIFLGFDGDDLIGLDAGDFKIAGNDPRAGVELFQLELGTAA